MKSPRRSFLKMLGFGPLITRFAPAKFIATSGATEPKWTAPVTKDGDFEWTELPRQSVTVTNFYTDRGSDVHWDNPSKFHLEIPLDDCPELMATARRMASAARRNQEIEIAKMFGVHL